MGRRREYRTAHSTSLSTHGPTGSSCRTCRSMVACTAASSPALMAGCTIMRGLSSSTTCARTCVCGSPRGRKSSRSSSECCPEPPLEEACLTNLCRQAGVVAPPKLQRWGSSESCRVDVGCGVWGTQPRRYLGSDQTHFPLRVTVYSSTFSNTLFTFFCVSSLYWLRPRSLRVQDLSRQASSLLAAGPSRLLLGHRPCPGGRQLPNSLGASEAGNGSSGSTSPRWRRCARGCAAVAAPRQG